MNMMDYNSSHNNFIDGTNVNLAFLIFFNIFVIEIFVNFRIICFLYFKEMHIATKIYIINLAIVGLLYLINTIFIYTIVFAIGYVPFELIFDKIAKLLSRNNRRCRKRKTNNKYLYQLTTNIHDLQELA